MTLDKFGRHISKRYKLDTSVLEQNIVKNVEKQIIENFGNNTKFVEEGVEKLFQTKIGNVEDNLRRLNKRISDDGDKIENIAKKIKFLEDTNEQEYNKKITNLNNNIKENYELINKLSQRHENLENNSNSLKEKYDQLREFEKEIINDITLIKSQVKDTTALDVAKKEVSKQFAERFQKYTNMLNDRVATEVQNFTKQHEIRDKKVEDIKKSVALHNLVHKNDKDNLIKLSDQIKKVETKIGDQSKIIETKIGDQINKIETQISSFSLIEEKISKTVIDVENMLIALEQKIINKLNSDVKKIYSEINDDRKKNLQRLEEEFKKLANFEEKIEEYKHDVDNVNIVIADVFESLEKSYKEIKDSVTDNTHNIKNLNEIKFKVNDLYEKNSKKIDEYKHDVDVMFEDLKKSSKDELKKTTNTMFNDFYYDLNNLEKSFNEIKYNVTENTNNLKNLEAKLFQELKTLNELVQKSDDVSRKEFNDTMKVARDELNATVKELNIRIDGFVDGMKEVVIEVDKKILSKIGELENMFSSRIKELENKHI